jgi:hypothetical protein
MRLSVAGCTQRDQVQLGIIPGVAAQFFVVDLGLSSCRRTDSATIPA